MLNHYDLIKKIKYAIKDNMLCLMIISVSFNGNVLQ